MARLPVLLRLGPGIFALGALADLLYHLLPQSVGAFAALGPDGAYAHAATVVGLLIALAGLFQMGLSDDE